MKAKTGGGPALFPLLPPTSLLSAHAQLLHKAPAIKVSVSHADIVRWQRFYALRFVRGHLIIALLHVEERVEGISACLPLGLML